jgi:hypothetical protein
MIFNVNCGNYEEFRLRDVTPCDSCKNQRFRRTYLFNHHGEKNQRARNI